MSDNVFSMPSLAERNHRAFVERESRRARQISALGGLRIIDLPREQQPDGTRSEWCALLDKSPTKSQR